jgi:hypothetical protein
MLQVQEDNPETVTDENVQNETDLFMAAVTKL